MYYSAWHMKVDLAWPTPLVIMVAYDRQVLSPSSSCPLKISLSLHSQTSKFILRCASVTWQTLTLLSHHSSSLSACPARQKRAHFRLPVCCKSPQLALFLSLMHTPTSVHKHAWWHTLILARSQKHGRWNQGTVSHPTGTRPLMLDGLIFWC